MVLPAAMSHEESRSDKNALAMSGYPVRWVSHEREPATNGGLMSNALKTTVLLAALTTLFVLLGGMLGGEQGMVVAFLMAAVMNFASYWWSDKIVLWMYGAQEVTEAD